MVSAFLLSVQDEWDAFQQLLTSTVLKACLDLSQNGFLSVEARDACLCASGQRPFKGQPGVHVLASSAQGRVRHEAGDLRARKLRTWLARCYEYKRLLCRSFENPLSRAQAIELEGLTSRLRHRFGNSLALRDVLAHIASLKAQLRQHESSVKTRRISEWRGGLVSSDAALSRWLKSKLNPVAVAVTDLEGRIAETDVSAAQMIFEYWDDFWKLSGASKPSLESRVRSMLQDIAPLAESLVIALVLAVLMAGRVLNLLGFRLMFGIALRSSLIGGCSVAVCLLRCVRVAWGVFLNPARSVLTMSFLC
jgi:hypothetical protein